MRLLQENQKEYGFRPDMKRRRRKPGGDKRRRVLKFSKGNKASEPGGIPKELLRYGGKNVITFLMNRFNEILMRGDKLQEWNSVYVCCIYKKGDKKDCNNYRGISIMNCIERVFSKVTKNKTKSMI